MASTENEADLPIQERRKRWKYRRISHFAHAGVLALVMGYLTVYGVEANGVQLALANIVPMAFIANVLGYIGGPIADDWVQLRVNRG